MYKWLYKNRFTTFFVSLMLILFGSLLFPEPFFQEKLMPIFFLVNISSGIILISKNRILYWSYISLFIFSLSIFGLDIVNKSTFEVNLYLKFILYFLFYSTVTYAIILQVWKAKKINKDVIIGLMCGYISLGLLGFFLFTAIEIYQPDSFQGILLENNEIATKIDSLLYYSYITLLTIGYGEIVPVTPIAQKGSILVGLIGQFYIVILTAIIVGKFLTQQKKSFK